LPFRTAQHRLDQMPGTAVHCGVGEVGDGGQAQAGLVPGLRGVEVAPQVLQRFPVAAGA
jgi:hypothetical protein